jgi:hypothetical protein
MLANLQDALLTRTAVQQKFAIALGPLQVWLRTRREHLSDEFD